MGKFIQTKQELNLLIINLYPCNGLLRIRVGDYRIIYRIENEELIVIVIKIAHRREVYQ
ncbi:type II toxin-antitoxin system RelE/ParE family toxin [Synechocystis sp. LEGE 06083]|uniref:type II toxin-antitoxin system RelE family toxin n=1 Tax=Synechocystis sp. LEGE 06083 TaxID=915336 RepID=UPI00188059A1|nr:type II toxin-antitoxin system RelE/ParE family toxin [Synechocystis sp. LEGE 06083]MBE9194267.1 type II toxin-antitoxin system RelE/ParE family toxin [Synechocystis sp. LEGE 06083]